ncbi:Fatty acyl reductase [Operophtera brumata]|uniref:Fatty acyl reductase n=1 Tax=Operophtera brumata TaxID=104452 RepID=A0A0L7L0L3_OPEBR|nr:Fatty acyl reductase [Operophtera brumata]
MIENTVNGMLHKYPIKSAVWYPHLKFMPSLLLFRISAIFWEDYFKKLHLGVRKFLNKESNKTMEAARSKDSV